MSTQVMNGAVAVSETNVLADLPQPLSGAEGGMVTLAVASWEALKAEREGLRQQVQELHSAAELSGRRWDQVVENAHEWANRANLCSEYDRFLEANDLPPRISDFEVTMEVQLEIVVRYAGRDRVEAEEDIGSAEICERLYGMGRGELRAALGDFTVINADRV